MNKIKNKFCKRYKDENGNVLLKYLYGDMRKIIPWIVYSIFFIFIIYVIMQYMTYFIMKNYEPFYELVDVMFWVIIIILSIFIIDEMSKKIGNLKIASCAMIKNKNNKINEDNENEL